MMDEHMEGIDQDEQWQRTRREISYLGTRMDRVVGAIEASTEELGTISDQAEKIAGREQPTTFFVCAWLLFIFLAIGFGVDDRKYYQRAEARANACLTLGDEAQAARHYQWYADGAEGDPPRSCL